MKKIRKNNYKYVCYNSSLTQRKTERRKERERDRQRKTEIAQIEALFCLNERKKKERKRENCANEFCT